MPNRVDEARITRDLLGLVGVRVGTREIMCWSAAKRGRAEDWAAKVHLRASDNIVNVPPRPRWLPKPSDGAEQTRRIFRRLEIERKVIRWPITK